MFFRSAMLLANPWAKFVAKNKANPALAGIAGKGLSPAAALSKRQKKLSQLWKALSPAAKAAYRK